MQQSKITQFILVAIILFYYIYSSHLSNKISKQQQQINFLTYLNETKYYQSNIRPNITIKRYQAKLSQLVKQNQWFSQRCQQINQDKQQLQHQLKKTEAIIVSYEDIINSYRKMLLQQENIIEKKINKIEKYQEKLYKIQGLIQYSMRYGLPILEDDYAKIKQEQLFKRWNIWSVFKVF